MEPGKEPRVTTGEKPSEPEPAVSFQARLWKNLQLGGKGRSGGGRAATERRTAEPLAPPPPTGGKGDLPPGAKWSGFKRRRQVLDRVFSSSQPNLCCSAAEPLEPAGESGSALRRLREHLLPQGKGPPPGRRPEPAAGCQGPEGGREGRRPGAHLSHQKSSSLPSTACLEQLLQGSTAAGRIREQRTEDGDSGARTSSFGASNADFPPGDPGMYQLNVTLRRGQNLAARDRGGTSDPYVKFKLGGKEVFRSKTVHKNLNPVWEEKASILIDNLREPLYIKVFDYDFGLQDDFIGSAFLDLTSLELNRQTDVTLSLKDPHYPDHDLGSIILSVLLAPGDQQEATMLMRKSWKRSSKFQTQSLRLSDLHRKSQLWRGIVSVTLIEGRELKAMDANGLSDPYVKFRLGHQKYKSKIVPKTLNPQWREQFDFHLYEERGGIIDITVWDKDVGKRDDFIGRCQVDLSTLSKEQTHKLEMPLEEGEGYLVLLVTLTASAAVTISDLSINSLEDQKEREEILKRYSPMMMFHNISDVGFLQVKVIRAEALMAADVTGKSDPFCVVELNNDRLLTHTVYRNLNPEWNKIFTFNIKDIHSVLEVTVYDEDRDRSADFLGKVAIPLLSIQNGEQKAYVLKNKQLTGPTKGVIYLEIDVIFNAVKASIRTLMPKEQKYIEEEDRLSKQLLLRNFIRMKHCIMALVTAVCYISSCFDWDSPPRSLAAFLLFLFVVWNFELYMIPLALLLLLAWNYFLIVSGKDNRQHDTVVEDMLEDEEEEDDRDDKDSEKKGFMNRLYAIQEVCVTVQNILDEIASFGERIKNTFNWTVPFLSWLAIVALSVFTIILYFIPLRYIVLVWGINKFTKKIRNPYAIDNNELLDFLSRVPSDVQVMQYHELKQDPTHSPSKRKKNNPA
ncbi:multiple C2 and transmembrane domain-containing protein 1 isoform X1 [Corvus cornix cornix]|uniref:Multiple C2 and transmembrane domain-containing protein 1 n=1 Tax=Corvus moneduloides TaxID=1196302 RepID=A0A8C3GX89_CORMO|nr:multiple C2 and transmembrane domain-containing protein 1 isoform X1 [Corvus moneduloides]XP_039423053.1 multiple C2 and transmembrane domain-containing protein 1 isoform X1 [Corvus cornix cornix]